MDQYVAIRTNSNQPRDIIIRMDECSETFVQIDKPSSLGSIESSVMSQVGYIIIWLCTESKRTAAYVFVSSE